MAEQEAHDSETLVKDENEEVPDIESQVKVAMRSRVGHFKDQADSLTFEGVRRLLEKDMGLEAYALDVHKRFIKQLLQELLEEANDANDSKHEETEEKGNYEETGEKGVAGDEEANSPEEHQPNKDVKESLSKDEEKMGDSPVLGLLTGNKTTESKTEESKGVNEKKAPNKSMIKTAIRKRTQYLKANLENLSIRDLRRLLEKDLKLDMYSLDPYKKFIGDQVDEVLSSSEVSKPAPTVKKNVGKNNSQRKVAKKASSEENSDSLGDESDEEEVRPRKKTDRKGKMDSNGSKRKRPAKDTKISGKKRVKPAIEDNSDEEDNGNISEDGQSQSSAEKSTKKKVVSTPAYGKRVENLKSIIKACGMSVPPSIYKKVKQVPENKREAQLIKELEEILSKEGLSANPSEKEIKECKKRKERARELEGIDTSNIVSSSRRRSTTSFVAPPKPKIPVEKDAADGEGTEDDGDDDDDEEEEEDNGNSAESQSEESNEDDDDDDENSD
ncbi:hypothetical protein UlMin_034601 [Ulmus minor]